MGYRWNFLLSVITFLAGTGALLPFLFFDSVGLKTIFLLFGIALILLAILRWLSLLFISLPEGHCKRLATSAGVFSAGLYYLLAGQLTIWIALAWILVIVGFLAILTALQRILVELEVLKRLSSDYERGAFPTIPVPFVYVLAEPGLGVYLGQRLVAKIMRSLWEYRYLPAESGLTLYIGSKRSDKWWRRYLWKYRQRGMILFLVSDSVRRRSIDFRQWLTRQAAAFVVIHTPLGEDDLDTGLLNSEVHYGYQLCPGPTFTIYARPLGKSAGPSAFEGDQVLECSWGLQNRSLESIVAPLTNRLASTVLYVTASDAQLSKEARTVIQEITAYALPPIADCYLRFRLAQSDVERFLSLLDCIECLVRCSVITLVSNQWNQMNTDVSYKELVGRPPTLGTWVGLLQKLTKIEAVNELDRELCNFWKVDMLQVQKRLTNEVSKTRLPLSETRGSSQLDWLKWFRDLRNMTRGHGIVVEDSVAPLWHGFHETFLRMVLSLRSLTLSSVLIAAEPNGGQVPLRGWLRGGYRPCTESFRESPESNAVAVLRLPSKQALLLHPLAAIHGNNVLLWDCVRKEEATIELLNYASWDRERLPFSKFSESDPYIIWKNARDSSSFLRKILILHNSG
jgi:hypothetical protein